MNSLVLIILDYLAVLISVLLAYKSSPSYTDPVFVDGTLNQIIVRDVLLLPLFVALGLQAAGVRTRSLERSPTGSLIIIMLGVGVGVISYIVVNAMLAYALIGRFVVGFTIVYGSLLLLALRIAIRAVRMRYARPLLLLTSDDAFHRIQETLRVEPLAYSIAAHISSFAECADPAIQKAGETLYEFCRARSVQDIVVESDSSMRQEDRTALLGCTAMGIRVVDINTFFEVNYERVYEAAVDESWLWGYEQSHTSTPYRLFKRLLDILCSLAGLAVLMVLLPPVMIAMWFTDRGPLIYTQTRVGLYNRTFRIFKIRSMRVDAEAKGPVWAARGDSRVTALGKILRRSRIDELPQCWNILRGDMSMIGPRPERPEFITEIEAQINYYRFRHIVKPGLTGWAQINYPYGASITDTRHKLSYDLFYIKYCSIALDLLILVRTVSAMVRGAR